MVAIHQWYIFVVMQHGETELKNHRISELLPFRYKIYCQLLTERDHFLHVFVRKNNQFVTDQYIRPADTHQYLHVCLCNVQQLKKSVSYSQSGITLK